MATRPQIGLKELEKVAAELAENAALLEPKTPAENLAIRIIEEAEPDFLAELGRMLMVGHFTRLVRAARAAQSKADRQQLLLPGYAHLPIRIIGKRDRRLALRTATYADVQRYCKFLGRQHRERKDNDAKLAEANELLEKMRKASKKTRGITVAEVLGLER